EYGLVQRCRQLIEAEAHWRQTRPQSDGKAAVAPIFPVRKNRTEILFTRNLFASRRKTLIATARRCLRRVIVRQQTARRADFHVFDSDPTEEFTSKGCMCLVFNPLYPKGRSEKTEDGRFCRTIVTCAALADRDVAERGQRCCQSEREE